MTRKIDIIIILKKIIFFDGGYRLPKMGQQFKSFGYLDGYSFLKMMDYLWMLLIFLALIACFTAFGMLRTRK
jgi:hypothetical protein